MMTDAERIAHNLPTRAEEFARPTRLTKQGKKAYDIVMAVLRGDNENIQSGGCKVFYTPAEWKKRGEEYGTKSSLVVVYDGGEHRDYFTYGDAVFLQNKMQAALAKEGFFFEECTSWYGAIYER